MFGIPTPIFLGHLLLLLVGVGWVGMKKWGK
jgi:hypothetical protein